MSEQKDQTEKSGELRCSAMQHAIDRVKRHFAPHDPNTPRALLSEMLDDMKALCDLAIQKYDQEVAGPDSSEAILVSQNPPCKVCGGIGSIEEEDGVWVCPCNKSVVA